VQVIFLHGGTAAKDGTEGDGEGHEKQWRKKMEPAVLSGEETQEGGESLAESEEEKRKGVAKAVSPAASARHTFSFDGHNDEIGGSGAGDERPVAWFHPSGHYRDRCAELAQDSHCGVPNASLAHTPRAWTTQVLALSALPLPMGHPCC
jgi:hypothetical protein